MAVQHDERLMPPLPTEMGDSELVGVFTDGSQEWHDARSAGVGSSEIASMMNVRGAYSSRYLLWMDKAGQRPPKEYDESTLEMFHFGHLQEDTADARLQLLRPHEYAMPAGSWRHKEDHGALLNPDRLVWDAAAERWRGREYKASGHGWDRDELPTHYAVQAEWCRGSLGLDEWELHAIIGGLRMESWIIKPGPFQSILVEHVKSGRVSQISSLGYDALKFSHRHFMDSLRKGNPPPFDGTAEENNFIRSKSTGLDEDHAYELKFETAQELHQADADFKESDRRLTLLKTQILDGMGDKRYAVVQGEGKPVVVARRQAPSRGNSAPSLRLSTAASVKKMLNVAQ